MLFIITSLKPELMNMDLGAISARINAPNDGRNASGPVVAPVLALTSKLNSDATGMRYQWGRKDPFTYATSSEYWGGWDQTGKYPVKLYTIDGVLIYQEDRGGDNIAKVPLGGVISPWTDAGSMMATIANPITYYGGDNRVVINQEGHSGDLYNYYWTSYSRGVDGKSVWPNNEPNWHNVYLDGYIPLRAKSIYDPCPYLYRIPSNGTYNQFNMQTGWTSYSYLGGASWKMNTEVSWLFGLGLRNAGSSSFGYTGRDGNYYSGTAGSQGGGYLLGFIAGGGIYLNQNQTRSYSHSVRCIDFAMLVQFLLTRHSSCKHGSALVSGVI